MTEAEWEVLRYCSAFEAGGPVEQAVCCTCTTPHHPRCPPSLPPRHFTRTLCVPLDHWALCNLQLLPAPHLSTCCLQPDLVSREQQELAEQERKANAKRRAIAKKRRSKKQRAEKRALAAAATAASGTAASAPPAATEGGQDRVLPTLEREKSRSELKPKPYVRMYRTCTVHCNARSRPETGLPAPRCPLLLLLLLCVCEFPAQKTGACGGDCPSKGSEGCSPGRAWSRLCCRR